MKNTTKQKPNGYWNNYENNKAEAKKYNSRREFYKGNGSAYNVARKNGWLDNYTWFKEKQKHNYWNNYNNNKTEAQKYNSRSEFAKGCQSAYNVACKNGWLDNYTWLKEKKQPNGYWNNYENNKAEAKKYNSRREFYKGCSGAYHVARQNGWLETYTWFEKDLSPYKNKRDNVYAFIFEELKSIYIGRTIDINRRYKQHSTDEKCTVYKFAKQNNTPIPQITILEIKLSLDEGREKEHYYVTKYKQEGWNVLNRAKTGKNSGSLGGIAKGKWNKKTCFQEAQKYNSRREFEKGCVSAYNVACKNGWLDTYTWFSVSKTAKKWNEQTCLAEAKKYNSRREFEKGCVSAYRVTCKNGWLDNYTWFIEKKKPSGYWNNYENNKAEAQKYNSRREFQKGCVGAYYVARKNGWLDNYTWFIEKKKPSGYWTYETCLAEAKKYNSRREFYKGCNSAYNVALKNGWLDNYTWFISTNELKKIIRTKWTYETCYQEAKKYNSRNEFKKGNESAYNVALKNGWLDIFFPKTK